MPGSQGQVTLPFDRYIRLDPDIDGIAGIAMPLRIVESHDMRGRGCEGAGKYAFEGIVRGIVRPQCKDAWHAPDEWQQPLRDAVGAANFSRGSRKNELVGREGFEPSTY